MNITFKFLIIALIIYSVPSGSYSQVTEKNLRTTEIIDSAILQHNKLFDNAQENMANIFPINKSGNVRPFTIGTEIRGYFYSKDYPLIELYGASMAIYPGYSYSYGKRIHDFGEHPHMNNIYLNNTMEYNSSAGYIFFTPGISVFSKSRKFSLDLYQRFSTQIFINGNQQITPYKVSVHF
jgi:hypothetical protein